MNSLYWLWWAIIRMLQALTTPARGTQRTGVQQGVHRGLVFNMPSCHTVYVLKMGVDQLISESGPAGKCESGPAGKCESGPAG